MEVVFSLRISQEECSEQVKKRSFRLFLVMSASLVLQVRNLRGLSSLHACRPHSCLALVVGSSRSGGMSVGEGGAQPHVAEWQRNGEKVSLCGPGL